MDARSGAQRHVRFRRLADAPVVYFARGFLTEDECASFRRLSDAIGYQQLAGSMECTDLTISKCEHLLSQGAVSEEDVAFMRQLQACQAALTGSEDTCTMPYVRVSEPPSEGAADDVGVGKVTFPMHLDVYREDAYVTVLVYLSTLDPDQGGQTLFPMAVRRGCEASAAKRAGDLPELIDLMIWEKDYGLRHLETAAPLKPEPRLNALAEQLAAGAAGLAGPGSGQRDGGDPHLFWGVDGLGLAVTPRRGDAVCFFTRRTNGTIDPAAWHGVAAMSARSPVRCLSQLWGHLPKQRSRRRSCTPETRPTSFCKKHAWLRSCAVGSLQVEVVEDMGSSDMAEADAKRNSDRDAECELRCPHGHGLLKPFKPQAGFPCDVCGREAATGDVMWGCHVVRLNALCSAPDTCDRCRRERRADR